MAEGIEGRSAPPLQKVNENQDICPCPSLLSCLLPSLLVLFDLLGQEVPERALETLARAPLKLSGGSTLGDLCEAACLLLGVDVSICVVLLYLSNPMCFASFPLSVNFQS